MPALDTYKGIERFAKYPKDPAALQGFHWLKHRAETAAYWEAARLVSADHLDLGVQLYIGNVVKEADKNALTAEKLSSMGKEEATKMFSDIYKSVGLVYPTTLSEDEHKTEAPETT